MSLKVIVWGQASQKNYNTWHISYEESQSTILRFLQEKKIPIGSSCFGEGICRKCIINDHLLACQNSLQSLLDETTTPPTITISIAHL